MVWIENKIDDVLRRAQPEVISHFAKEKTINSKTRGTKPRVCLSPKDYTSG